MKHSIRSKQRRRRQPRSIKLLFAALLLIGVAIALLPYWPEQPLLSMAGYLLLFAPRWWVLGLPLLLLLCFRRLYPWQRWTLVPLLLVCLNFIDLQWQPSLSSADELELEVPVMSVNLGNSGDKRLLKQQITANQPYIVFLQEARIDAIEMLFDDSWHTDCVSILCIASRFPLERQDHLSRRTLGGWGSYAVKYSAQIFGQPVQLVNVHLDTPRGVLEGLLHLDLDLPEAGDSILNRDIQAGLISNWIDPAAPAIIAGDFNMPVNENIYRQHLSHLNNALDAAPIGLRYTKYTRWHGIRIDHILFNDAFRSKQAKVLSDFGGDHRPIFTVLGQSL